MSECEVQRRSYDENLAFLRLRLDSHRTGATPNPTPTRARAFVAQSGAAGLYRGEATPLGGHKEDMAPQGGGDYGRDARDRGGTQLGFSPLRSGVQTLTLSPGRDKGGLSVGML